MEPASCGTSSAPATCCWPTRASGRLASRPAAPSSSPFGFALLPLAYTHVGDTRGPDITVVALLDSFSPGHERLVTRLRSQGVRVRLPQGIRPGYPAETPDDYQLLKSLVADNIERRPVYL